MGIGGSFAASCRTMPVMIFGQLVRCEFGFKVLQPAVTDTIPKWVCVCPAISTSMGEHPPKRFNN